MRLAALLCLALLAAPTPRNPANARRFMRETGYPHGRPGWIVDHVIPLARGGADDSANLQWQTKADAACKDQWEQFAPLEVLKRRAHGRGRLAP